MHYGPHKDNITMCVFSICTIFVRWFPLSVCVFKGVVFNDVYAASKFAVEGFCESLAVQLLKFNIT